MDAVARLNDDALASFHHADATTRCGQVIVPRNTFTRDLVNLYRLFRERTKQTPRGVSVAHRRGHTCERPPVCRKFCL